MKCPGCGTEIQFTDPSKSGYIPYSVYEKRLSNGDEILCQRCFRAKHYGKLEPVEVSDNFVEQVKRALSHFKTALWIVDITDFEGSFDPNISEILRDHDKIMVVNKVDLVPRAVSLDEMRDWVLEQMGDETFNEVHLISAAKGFGIHLLQESLEAHGGNFLVVGATNVGKSSLVSKLCMTETTVTAFPGTTLGILKRKMQNSGSYLYDTPGIKTGRRITDLLDPQCQKELTPTDHLSRKTFKPKRSGSVLFIGGLCHAVIKFEGKSPIFQVFAPNAVKFHETSQLKYENFLRKHYGKLLTPPCKSSQLPFESIEWQKIRFELQQGEELSIAGLGWISVRRGPFVVEIRVPLGITVRKRAGLINPYRDREGGMKSD